MIITFGSATDFYLGYIISFLIVGVPNTLFSSPYLVLFLNPCLVAFPKSSSILTSFNTAYPVKHLAF